MTPEFSTHLSEEALHDVLIGLSSPASDAHLAACPACRGQVQEFRSDMQLFNQTTLAWSEAMPAAQLSATSRPAIRPAYFAPARWALAAAVLLAVGLPVWRYYRHSAPNYASVPVTQSEDTEAQIAQDNELLRSINMALSANETSPIREYHLSDRPHDRSKTRPELRNR